MNSLGGASMTQGELLLVLGANVVAMIASSFYAFRAFSAQRGIRPTGLRVANIFVKAVLVSGLTTMLGFGSWSLVWSLHSGHGLWESVSNAVLYGLGYGTPLALFGVPGSIVASLVAFAIYRRGRTSRST